MLNEIRKIVQTERQWRAIEREALDSPADFWRGLWLALLIGAALLFVVGLAVELTGLVSVAVLIAPFAYAGLMYCGGVR